MPVCRRTVLRSALGLSVIPLAGFTTDLRRSPVHADPFTLGVASGEPTPDGVVLWTRLAPRPLTADGSGGMPSRSVDVEWELASDERFARVEQRGVVAATPQWGHSVHIETTGLRAGAEYFYRFRAQGFLSPVGRTRTAPQPDSLAPMTMCFASCSNYEQGWFTAYRRLAEEDSDLVLHLGDYLYETVAGGAFRAHAGSEAASLATYRQRYAQYKTDPDLQAAHAAAPWLVVFDDHELDDNWAGSVPEQPQPDFRTRRAAALRAYYENMPLRSTALPRGTDMTLFRRVGWGALATFHMLDTRGYRTDQVCGDAYRSDCPERADPAGSLLGPHQKQWLLNGFRQSQARWDLIGQQVFFSQIDLTPGAARGFNPDAWDGYAADRDQVTAGLLNSAVRNAVVLTGDVHSHWAAEVHERPGDVSSRRAATELVTTSISSGGDGSDGRADIDAILPENPHIRYFSNRRGYVRTRITADALRADFREVPFVTRPGAPVHTGATFVVPDRVPRLL